ncbi:hypothetical protein GV794_23880 [Nocardia cyriacigeorgica]|uniref:DUF2637 domain-containing protein n=1 Tax=Nocardia cyriacigeorgica TaxID=135487 RepID=A0A6P1D9E7_9NOCA|nr:hypothetical protein [Nocardia cyriacigeorgica]NEW39783.1 hypothetical protein [Nocardia cyriacigeorgica]NEW45510.1 hypothetical protein [Nocardia cyriacigeorgica]NEW52417.1 hypothetical protein [Nocardia cyriacigeorgica]NEW58660.1 hypothetical protein [Nocardia cyriacigeorgica]
MTIEHPIEDEVSQLARRVEKARGRLAYQFDPALTDALSEDELHAERELAERIRVQDRAQRWKQAQAAAAASDRARQTTEEIEKADIRDLLLARKAIANQQRESSPHAKLASLYRHRAWSLRALAGVVGAGMLWSAVNVQQNIAPGGPGDPLYWFSYLIEAMISVCLIIIMIGTNKVSEWGVVDNRQKVAAAEIALLALTVSLNTYPYVRDGQWYEAAVHAVAPVMIGVALLIHDAVSARYGLAIARATEQVKELPDPAEQIRNRMPSISSFRLSSPDYALQQPVIIEPDVVVQEAVSEPEVVGEPVNGEVLEFDAETEVLEQKQEPAAPRAAFRASNKPATPKVPISFDDDVFFGSGDMTSVVERSVASPTVRAASNGATSDSNGIAAGLNGTRTAATEAMKTNGSSANSGSGPSGSSNGAAKPVQQSSAAVAKASETAATTVAAKTSVAARPAESKPADSQAQTVSIDRPEPAPAFSAAAAADTAKMGASRGRKAKGKASADGEPTLHEVVNATSIYDTGQFRIAEELEKELAEMQAARRRARTSKQR